jgi:hypothetical protein
MSKKQADLYQSFLSSTVGLFHQVSESTFYLLIFFLWLDIDNDQLFARQNKLSIVYFPNCHSTIWFLQIFFFKMMKVNIVYFCIIMDLFM